MANRVDWSWSQIDGVLVRYGTTLDAGVQWTGNLSTDF